MDKFYTNSLLLTLTLSLLLNIVLGCHRWNCPCKEDATANKRNVPLHKRFHALSQKALQTRRKTENLIQRMRSERFRDNESHISSLTDCVHSRRPSCMQTHLSYDCNLEGLPTLHQGLTGSHGQTGELVRDARAFLTALAVFVDQARKEEENNTDPHRSLSTDIWHLQENGIYHLLCAFEAKFGHIREAWIPSVPSGLMQSGCRQSTNRAIADNRNYMVFYTLQKLLDDFGHQFHSLGKRLGQLGESEDYQTEHKEADIDDNPDEQFVAEREENIKSQDDEQDSIGDFSELAEISFLLQKLLPDYDDDEKILYESEYLV